MPPALRTAVRVILLVLVAVAIGQLAVGLDWRQIGAALSKLTAGQLLVLLVIMVARQWLNALPIAIFVDGCGPLRAMQNNQSAVLLTTVAPPPADLLLRLQMFRSWGIATTEGMTGTLLTSLSFYVVCFATPIVGVVLLAATTGTVLAGELVPALLCVLVSVAVVVVLRVGVRADSSAASLGLRAGRLAHRVRRSVDPQRWASAMVDFRRSVASRIGSRFPRALAALAAMVAVEAVLLVLGVRFVGVPAAELGAGAIAAALLLVFPMKLLPLSGLGLLDATLVAVLIVQVGVSAAHEADLVAALLVWRVVTLIVPVLLGAVSLLAWKVRQRDVGAS